MIGRIRRAAVLAFASALAACGVPAEAEPRPIALDPSQTSSASGQDAAAPATDGGPGSSPAEEILYFVRGGHLVVVRRPVDGLPPPQTHLEDLLAGPTDTEHDEGLSSALTGLSITAQLRIDGTTAVVELGVRPDDAGRSDEVLAYGQLVCTLTARADIDRVAFHYQGEPVDVPRGDASLGRLPLTAADYRSLVAPE
jgi:hypothetical protein